MRNLEKYEILLNVYLNHHIWRTNILYLAEMLLNVARQKYIDYTTHSQQNYTNYTTLGIKHINDTTPCKDILIYFPWQKIWTQHTFYSD